MIARVWRGRVATGKADAYVAYVTATGIAGYLATPGNRGAQLLTRDLGDGRTEIVTLSWWDSIDSVRAFAGDDVDVARYYPEDDEFLVDRETTVSHFEVAEGPPPGA